MTDALADLARRLSPSALPELDRRAEWRTFRADEPAFAYRSGNYPYADAATFIRAVLRLLDAEGIAGWWTGHPMLEDPPAPSAAEVLAGPCGDPACPVLHADPAHPVHPPDYVDSRAAARLVAALHTVFRPEAVVAWLNHQAGHIESAADGTFS